MVQVVEIEFSGKKFSIEHGRVARQTNGAVLVRYSDTMVLVTVVSAEEAKEESYFLPLIVDYVEMTYAAGKIPGGFFKREGRPTERETLISRLIDRSIRPLFLENFHNDVQVIATVLSVDQENDPDVIAIVGASAALTVSDIPFSNPVAGVRIGRVDGDFICNPTYIQRKKSDIDIIVAGTKSVIVMVEGSVDILPEDVVLDAIMFAHEAMQPLLSLQESLQNQVSNDKREFPSFKIEVELAEKIKGTFFKRVEHALSIPEKTRRKNEIHHIEKDAVLQFSEELGLKGQEVIAVLDDLQRAIVRDNYSREKIRIDGRKFHEIRPITCEVGVLPRVHGSAIFTRGETQVLVATTLGTTADEQRLDSLSGESSKSFMLHYNFLPFSVGEVRFLRAPSRREIGHGALAEKAISIVLPESDEFPYTIRVVSDVLESNGSSSMATVCGGILSLMDAGVSIKAPVAGIAMGLLMYDDEVMILSDILGDEDHIGDMDFKVAGTKDGITALQMDIKVEGITGEILRQALYQAQEGRLFILEKMMGTIEKPREDISAYAPRICAMHIKPDKIKDIIGPGGKTIKGIIEQTGVKIEVENDGKVSIASHSVESCDAAIKMIKELTQEVEVGEIYLSKVKKIMDFGAIAEVLPGVEGLIHISQLADSFVKNVRDIVKEGDEVPVKVIEIDNQGRMKLSRKEALGGQSES